ncbi:hypothetical protein Tco_0365203 [Tanacetum coccineum]
MPVKEAEKEDEAENEPNKKAGKDETTEAPSSQPVEYYLKHRINEKLIEISPGMRRKDKTSPRKGDEVRPMEDQKFQNNATSLVINKNGEIMQQFKQGLSSVITVKEKGIWQGNALSQRGQGTQHGSRIKYCQFKQRNHVSMCNANSKHAVKDANSKFSNDQIAKIMGYGDYQIRNVKISKVYYMEGLGYNLFSVGQFCDFDLEVAF